MSDAANIQIKINTTEAEKAEKVLAALENRSDKLFQSLKALDSNSHFSKLKSAAEGVDTSFSRLKAANDSVATSFGGVTGAADKAGNELVAIGNTRAALALDSTTGSATKTGTALKLIDDTNVDATFDDITDSANDASRSLGKMGIDRVSDDFGDFSREAGKADDAMKKGNTTGASFTQTFTKIRLAALGAATAIGATLGVFVNLSDRYKSMNAGIGIVTDSTEDMAFAQSALAQSAKDARTPLEDISRLYTSMTPSLDEMGRSQEEVLRVTELVSKALKVGGGATGEHTAALQQFSQAMGSGVLRGDEFNSIMENGRGLALQLAEGLDVPVGSLREMAEAGDLTADIVVDALLRQGVAIDGLFNELPVKSGQAWTLIKNQALLAIGGIDESLGVASAWSGLLVGVAEAMEKAIGPVTEKVAELKLQWNGFTDDFQSSERSIYPLLRGIVDGFDEIGSSLGRSGPLLGGIATGMMAIGGTHLTIGLLAGAFGLVSKALIGLNTAVLANPITAAVYAIGIAAYVIYDNWDEFSEWWSGMWTGAKDAAKEFADWLSSGQFIDDIRNFGQGTADAYAGGLKDGGSIQDSAREITQTVSSEVGSPIHMALMEDHGAATGQRLADGLAASNVPIKKTVEDIAETVKTASDKVAEALNVQYTMYTQGEEAARRLELQYEGIEGAEIDFRIASEKTIEALREKSEMMERVDGIISDLKEEQAILTTELEDGAFAADVMRHETEGWGKADAVTAATLKSSNELLRERIRVSETITSTTRDLAIEQAILVTELQDGAQAADVLRLMTEGWNREAAETEVALRGTNEQLAEQIQNAGRVKDAIQSQKDAQYLQNIEVTQGADAADHARLMMEGYSSAQATNAIETANNMAFQREFYDTLVGSLTNADSIKDVFSDMGKFMKDWLKEKIDTFAANKIMVFLGMGDGGFADGLGGILANASSVMSKFGSDTTSTLTGMGNSVSQFLGLTPSFTGSMTAAQGATAGTTTALGSFAAAAGSVAAAGVGAAALAVGSYHLGEELGRLFNAADDGKAAIGGLVGSMTVMGPVLGAAIGSAFGGAWERVEQGFEIAFTDGALTGKGIEYFEKERSLWRGTASQVLTKEIDPLLLASIQATFDSMNSALVSQSEALGIEGADQIMNGFSISIDRLKGGEPGELLAAAIEQEFREGYGDAFRKLGPEMQAVILEAVDPIVSSLEDVGAAFGALAIASNEVAPLMRAVGIDLPESFDAAGVAAYNFVEASGGAAAAIEKLTLYNNEFVPAADRANLALDGYTRTLDTFNESIGRGEGVVNISMQALQDYHISMGTVGVAAKQLGVTLDTNTGLYQVNESAIRDLINSQDASTESGKRMRDGLLGLIEQSDGLGNTAITTRDQLNEWVNAGGNLADVSVETMNAIIAHEDALKAQLETTQSVAQIINDLNGRFDETSPKADDVANSIVLLMGGLDQFSSEAAYFSDNFYSAAQKQGDALVVAYGRIGEFNQEVEGLGLSSVTSKEGLVKLYESIDQSTLSGAELASKILLVDDAFVGVAQAEVLRAESVQASAEAARKQGLAFSEVAKATASLNLKFDATAPGAREAASGLIDLMGSLDKFNEANKSYVTKFYSEQERSSLALASSSAAVKLFNDQIGFTGDAVIDTRDEFRSYVEGLDLQSDAGRKAYAAAMDVSDSMFVLTESGSSLQEAIGNLPPHLQKSFDQLNASASQAGAELPVDIGIALSSIVEQASVAGPAMRDALVGSFEQVMLDAGIVKDQLPPKFQEMYDSITQGSSDAYAEVTSSASTMVTAANDADISVTNSMGNLSTSVTGFAADLLPSVEPHFRELVQASGITGTDLVESLGNAFTTIVSDSGVASTDLVTALRTGFEGVMAEAGFVRDNLPPEMQAMYDDVMSGAVSASLDVSASMGDMATGVADFASQLLPSMDPHFKELIQASGTTGTDLVTKLNDAFIKVVGNADTTGVDLNVALGTAFTGVLTDAGYLRDNLPIQSQQGFDAVLQGAISTALDVTASATKQRDDMIRLAGEMQQGVSSDAADMARNTNLSSKDMKEKTAAEARDMATYTAASSKAMQQDSVYQVKEMESRTRTAYEHVAERSDFMRGRVFQNSNDMVTSIGGIVNAMFNSRRHFTDMSNAITSSANAANSARNPLGNLVNSIYSLRNAASGAATSISNSASSIPRYASGTDYVANDYHLAYLDKGEMVPNADISNQLRAMGVTANSIPANLGAPNVSVSPSVNVSTTQSNNNSELVAELRASREEQKAMRKEIEMMRKESGAGLRSVAQNTGATASATNQQTQVLNKVEKSNDRISRKLA